MLGSGPNSAQTIAEGTLLVRGPLARAAAPQASATPASSAFQATAPQGELYLDVRMATPDESYAVQTPRGLISFTAPGRYGVVAGDTQNPTTVTVVEGSARITAIRDRSQRRGGRAPGVPGPECIGVSSDVDEVGLTAESG